MFSAQHTTTLFITLLATWSLLLHRLSQQKKIVVGVPVAGQSIAGDRPLVGYCVNLTPFCSQIDQTDTFAHFLKQVKESWLLAYSHCRYPFSKSAKIAGSTQVPGWFPVPSAAFNLDHVGELQFLGLTAEIFSNSTGSAKFDLYLNAIQTNEELLLEFEYNRDLFDERTIRQWAGQLKELLVNATSNPEIRLAEVPMLTDQERRRVLVDFNGKETAYPEDKCVHELFEQQVQRTPEAIAVLSNQARLTYGELNRRANLMAFYLMERGVGPEVCVGLCLERGLNMVIAMLAILKAGATYVPLDPSYPQERLRFMMDDTQLKIILTEAQLKRHLPSTDALMICVDSEWNQMEQRSSAGNPVLPNAADSLAYVMYTSGSTGTPKGIAVTHRGISRLVVNTNFATLNNDAVILQFSPISFDASTFEIWGCLLNGGRLVLFPSNTPSLEELGSAIEHQGVTTLWLTASLFHQMVENQVSSLRNVRQLLAGGDVLSVSHVKKAAESLPGCRLINGYGPTENTTFTCCYTVDASTLRNSVPIGKAIANTRVYVLDGEMQPVAVGAVGELCTAGAGLARGYWRQAKITAERFVPDPFAETPGERMYRTGDLVRWREDGNLEFVGRKDSQVKVRGFRVEPGEIESMLAKHAGVKEAVVVVKQEAGMEKRLAAYVVGQGQERVTGEELRKYLRERLPEYMVPGVIERVEEMPLNANGKVNRQELAKMEIRVEGGEGYEEPQGEVERELARIWAEVLRVKRVGAQQSFFELGGDSILAIQISARAKQAGMQVKPRQIFEQRTLRGVAQSIGQEKQAMAEQQAVVGEAPLTPIQHWFFDQQFIDSHHFNQAHLIGVEQRLEHSLFAQAVKELVKQHDALRFRYQKDGKGWRQFCEKPEEQVPFEVVDLREVEGEEERVKRLEEHARGCRGVWT